MIWVKLTEIRPNANNPRQISADDFALLKRSLMQFPEMLTARPLVCYTSDMGGYVILGGNQRYRALCDIGADEVPIVLADDWTPQQRDEFLIKDNTHYGKWDTEMLANEWDSVKLDEWGLDVPDFKVEPEAEEDDYEVPKTITTDIVPGDLFEIGPHRLLCGDSTNADDVARLMNGEKADMVFTDPPYGYNYESKYYKSGNPFGMMENDDKILDFMPCVHLFTQENCGIYICRSQQNIHKWRRIIDDYFTYKNTIIWKKNNWSMGDLEGAYAGQYEMILFYHKGRIKLSNGRDTDVWEFDRQKAEIHPTQKPVELISFSISKTSKNNCNNNNDDCCCS